MAKKKILFIDDEPDLVKMVQMRLEANSYEVIVAADGQEGLEKARSEKPDLILLDILMPKKDGYVFVKEAKADDSIKGIPIIVLTAKPGMKDLFAVEGIKDYILKPFDNQQLLDKIKKYLG